MQRITIDLTTLVDGAGPPHGISRLIARTVRGLLDAGVAVAFIRYSAGQRGFVRLEADGRRMLDVLEAPVPGRVRVVHPPDAAPAPQGVGVGLAGRLYYRLPTTARLALRNGTLGAVQAARTLATGAGALVRSARSGDGAITRFGGRDGAAYRPEPGEPVLLASALWGQPGVSAALDGLTAAGADVTAIVCDLLPIRRPEFFEQRFSARFADWALATLRTSTRILAISQATADDLAAEAARAGLACPPVTVLRLGDDGLGAAAVDDAVPAPVRALADRPFVLAVGTIEARKNHQLLYRVWRRLAQRPVAELPRLVIAGQPGWLTEPTLHALTHDPVLHGHVALVHGADDATVAWLLERSLFTLYPSFVEGWGLPVAESLARGRVVVAGTAPSLLEAGQGLAVHLDPDDVPAWAAMVMDLATRTARRAELEAIAAKSYKTVTWQDTTSALLTVLGVSD